jgi:hypothetical protein
MLKPVRDQESKEVKAPNPEADKGHTCTSSITTDTSPDLKVLLLGRVSVCKREVTGRHLGGELRPAIA